MRLTLILCLNLCLIMQTASVMADPSQTYDDYPSMRAQLGLLYGEERFTDAVTLLENHIDRFPDHYEANAYNLATMQIICLQNEAAVTVFNQAADKGVWYGKYYLEGELFGSISEMPAFCVYLERNKTLRENAVEETMQFKAVLPDDYDPVRSYPLFLAFHGGDGNTIEFSAVWHSKRLRREFILVYVQSSIASNMQGFSWYLPEEIRADVMSAYRQIQQQYVIDIDQIYVGGFSAGAIATFCMAFDSDLPLKGYICLGPPTPPGILTIDNIKLTVTEGTRGCVIIGDQDPFYPAMIATSARFDSLGHPCEVIVLPETGHTIPENLPLLIDQALDILVR